MRPFVTVNCAMTADGKIAGRSRKQLRISSQEDMSRVKRLRASSDAIVVGIGTVLSDDPHLTVKEPQPGKVPVRIVIDSNGRTPESAKVLDGRARTIIVTSVDCLRTWTNAEVIRAGKERVDLRAMLDELYRLGMRNILVEGGGEVLFSFFNEGLVDKYYVFIGSMIIGGRTSPTPADGDGMDSPLSLKLTEVTRSEDGVLLTYEAMNGK